MDRKLVIVVLLIVLLSCLLSGCIGGQGFSVRQLPGHDYYYYHNITSEQFSRYPVLVQQAFGQPRVRLNCTYEDILGFVNVTNSSRLVLSSVFIHDSWWLLQLNGAVYEVEFRPWDGNDTITVTPGLVMGFEQILEYPHLKILLEKGGGSMEAPKDEWDKLLGVMRYWDTRELQYNGTWYEIGFMVGD